MQLLSYMGKFRPFFSSPKKSLYKIYHDGGHHIGTLVNRKHITFKNTQKKDLSQVKQSTTQTMLFDNLYFNAFKKNLKGADLREYILNGMLKFYPNLNDPQTFLHTNIKRVISNMHKRKKRFKRKAYLNEWNYFVTFTYNDKIHTEETFRKKLRKCLSNLHTRRGWLYMGVFERAPETDRLHFHGLFYIPDGEMIGELKEVKDYDKHKGIMQTSYQNTFFTENYGRNDFKELHIMGNTINYLLKYIGKTNERIVYSRGIPTEVILEIDNENIAANMIDFVTKFILFDNIIDWSRDIKKFKRKQLTIKDILCNPPNN